MRKKGSMELGISTVVVLVIAIVIIAGGIAFIRGFFDKGTVELSKAFKVTDFSIQPNDQQPLVFAQGDTFSVKAGDKETIKIGMFNSESSARAFKIEFIECETDAKYEPSVTIMPKPAITALIQKIDPGEAIVFNAFVLGEASSTSGSGTAGKKLLAGTYLCKLEAKAAILNAVGQPPTDWTIGANVKNYASTDAVIDVYN